MKRLLKLIKQYGAIIGIVTGLLGFVLGAAALCISLESKSIISDKAEAYISSYVKDHADKLKGEAGKVGQQGSIGLQGPAGPQGSTGAIGPQGLTGARGMSGELYSPPSGMLCADYSGNVTKCGSYVTLGTLSTNMLCSSYSSGSVVKCGSTYTTIGTFYDSALCSSYSKSVTKCGNYYTVGTLN
jgi:hypothetical protein